MAATNQPNFFPEITRGIGIGLVCIVITVSIGSMIASAISKGPHAHGDHGDHGKAAQEAPAEAAPAQEAKPAE